MAPPESTTNNVVNPEHALVTQAVDLRDHAPPASQTPADGPVERAAPVPRHTAVAPAQRHIAAAALVVVAATAWAVLFAYLSLLRHASGGTNAQDLGFTDQVIWNFLQGDWFRMSLYVGAATWNTEMAVASIARPESLLAFHFEPMLALLAPIYALGGDARHLLILQSAVFALGAIPAYGLGLRWSGSAWAGAAVAAAYLLSPLGQSAMLADFHTTALAAPLILLAIERVAARKPIQALAIACLAITAREDVALAVGAAGAFVFLAGQRGTGLALAGIGGIGVAASVAVINWQSGGAWAFSPRYADLGAGHTAILSALSRPEVLEFVATILLSGGVLAMLTPLALVSLLPTTALNALSSSPWMASGRAHYSVLVLPFAVAGAAWALGRLSGLRAARPRRAVGAGAAALLLGAAVAHAWTGVGPLGASYAPSTVTEHARIAASMAASIPPHAAVSASSSLVPRVSRRSSVYLFPALGNAEYVFVDVSVSAAPTSPGDAYLRLQNLLAAGDWHLDGADDGILLLGRRPGTPPLTPRDLPVRFFSFVRGSPSPPTAPFGEPWAWLMPAPALAQIGSAPTRFDNANLELLGGEVVRAVDDTLAIDGVRGVLRTTWRATGPVPSGTWVEIDARLIGGGRSRISDIAGMWWYPPDQWRPGEQVRVEVEVPFRGVTEWSARARVPDLRPTEH